MLSLYANPSSPPLRPANFLQPPHRARRLPPRSSSSNAICPPRLPFESSGRILLPTLLLIARQLPSSSPRAICPAWSPFKVSFPISSKRILWSSSWIPRHAHLEPLSKTHCDFFQASSTEPPTASPSSSRYHAIYHLRFLQTASPNPPTIFSPSASPIAIDTP